MRTLTLLLAICGELRSAVADDAALCDAEYIDSVCPSVCSSTIADKCCAHAGKTAQMLIVPSPSHAWALQTRLEDFNACTGAQVELIEYVVQCEGVDYCGGFRGLFEVGIGAVDDATGAAIYDAYMTQAMDVPRLAPYVEDLRPRIRDTPELQWQDILPHVRKQHAVGDQQAALPYDLDFMNLLLRDDLVAAYLEQTGRKEPRTFEELADFAEYWHGRDQNGDGAPDFGICTLNGAGPGGPQALLMQIAAAKLQYLGTSQGMFFDPDAENLEPLVDNAGFREALRLVRRLWMASLDSEPGGWVYLHEEAWLEGKCAGYYWLTGSVAYVTTLREVGRLNEDGSYAWQPTFEDGTYRAPRRVYPPGSATVLDRESGEMKRCTAEIGESVGEDEVHCPFLDAARDERDGEWVNRVPYYYSAYQHSSISIREDAPAERRDVIWDLMVYANVEALPVVSQALGPTYLDPFRRSHFTEEARASYSAKWTEAGYAMLRDVFLWAGSSPNVGLPLNLAGREDFEYALEKLLWQHFLEVAPCADHVACKCAGFEGGRDENPDCGYGWGDHPNATMWARARRGIASLGEDAFVSALLDEYTMVQERYYSSSRAAADDHRVAVGRSPLPAGGKKSDRKEVRKLRAALIAVACACAALLIFIGAFLAARSVRKTYVKAQHLEAFSQTLVEKQCDEAQRRVRDFQAPFIAIRASDFVAMGRLEPHEVLRRKNLLHFADSVRDEFFQRNLTVFVSHQWLGKAHPDPDGAQYACVCAALRDVSKRSQRPLDEVYVWMDFLSIPQRCKPVQRLLVLSLPSLASAVDIFLAAAPKAENRDTKACCDRHTYSTRAWCRAEVFAHFSRRGGDVMFYATEKGLKPMFPAKKEGTEEALRDYLDIMHGELTCCAFRHAEGQPCDREELVLPVMGLFAEVYRSRHAETKHIFDALLEGGSVDYYFPRHLDYKTPFGTVVQRPLFGDLPRAIMARIDADRGLAPEGPPRKFTTPAADTRREPGLLEEQTFPRKFGKPRALVLRARSVADSQNSSVNPGGGGLVTPSHANSSAYGSNYCATSPTRSGVSQSGDDQPVAEIQSSDSLYEEQRTKFAAVARLASTADDRYPESRSCSPASASAERLSLRVADAE